MGTSMVGGFYRGRRKAGPETGINDPRLRVRNFAQAGPEACRRTSPPAECRQDHAFVEPDVPAVRGIAFHPEFSADIETLNAESLPPNPQRSPFACIWGCQ